MNTSSSINKSYQSLDSSTIDRWAKTRPGFNKPKIEKLTSKDIQKSILNATRKSPPRRRKNVRFTNSSSMDDTSTSSTVEVQESEEESASVASQEEDQKVSLNLYHNISEMRSFLCDFPEPEVFATADIPFGSESSSNNSPTNSCHSNEAENTTSNNQPCTKLPEKKRSTTSSSTLALLTGKKLRLKDIVLETKKSKVEERKTVQPQIQKPIKKPERPRELDLIEELRKINAQIEKDRQEALQNRQILNTSSTDTQTSPPPISSSVATQIEQILFPAMTHSSAPEPITYPESVSDVETEPEPRSATEIPLATEPDYYQTDVLACRQEISDYPFLSTTVKDSSEMTLSEAKHKIFTVFEEISSGHNSLRSRDKLLFTYKRPLVQEEDDLSVLKSIPIRSWDQCMKALTRIRLKRLSEIRHVVQEEREVIFTRSKIAELYTRAVTLRTKIKEERKKSFELLKRNNRRAKLGSKKPGPSKQLKKPATLLAGKSAATYQGTILDNHMSKLLAKMFFILLRNKLHVRRVTTDLIVRMEDESYEHLARSTLHILSYNRLKKKVLGNLLETCQRKSNRIKRRALFFMWRQAAADKHQQSYNERKATEYRNRLLLKRAFNTFVYGCLSNSLNNLGTAIARVWFEIKLLSRCYYGWRKIVTQEAYLRKGLCSLVFSDEQDDALNDLDSQVESYWQFRTKIIIKQKIHNDWTEQYKCLKEIAEHRRCYQMLDVRDQLRPQFYGQIFAHMPSESDDEVEVEERRNHDVQRAKVVKEKALVNSCKKKKENQANIQHAERSFYERISQSTLYEAADQVYKMKLLRRFFVSWCSQYHTVTLTRLAQKHYGEVVLRKSFVTLRQYRKRNDPEYIARNICRQVLIERCFKTWHQAYAMKTVRCLALSDRFRYESLLSKAFQGLRYYALFCKKQKADAEKIAAFRRKVTLNRAFKGLLLHLVERRIRQRLLDIARKHYEERLLRKSLATITLYSRRQSLINKIVGEAVEKRRKSQSIEDSNLLRKVVRVWYRMTQRANKRRQMLIMQYTAGVFYTKTMKRAAFATWCNRYKQALKLRMVYLQNLGIVRRVFIKWRDLVKERRRNHPQQPQPDLPKTQPETAPPKEPKPKPRPKLLPSSDRITTTTPKPATEHKTEHNKQGEENVKRKVFFIWREKYYENKIVAYFKKKRAMNALKHYAFNFSRITPLEFLMKRFFDRWRASASKRRSVGSESKSPSSSAVKQQ